jgi:hypothetical protein
MNPEKFSEKYLAFFLKTNAKMLILQKLAVV